MDYEERIEFGLLVRRLVGGGTAADFARELGVSRAAVELWANSKGTPGIMFLHRLAVSGATERAREFGRLGLAIKGLQPLDDKE